MASKRLMLLILSVFLSIAASESYAEPILRLRAYCKVATKDDCFLRCKAVARKRFRTCKYAVEESLKSGSARSIARAEFKRCKRILYRDAGVCVTLAGYGSEEYAPVVKDTVLIIVRSVIVVGDPLILAGIVVVDDPVIVVEDPATDAKEPAPADEEPARVDEERASPDTPEEEADFDAFGVHLNPAPTGTAKDLSGLRNEILGLRKPGS